MGLLTAPARVALQEESALIAFLCELDFSVGVERYWSGSWPLAYDGHTWIGAGGMGRVSAIESDADIRPKQLELELLGIPANLLRSGTIRAPQYKGRRALWIFALVDPAQTPSVIYAKPKYYYIDRVDYVVRPEGAGVRVTLEHETTYAARAAVRRYSDQDQRHEYPGDRGFEFLSFLASGKDIRWGASGTFFQS